MDRTNKMNWSQYNTGQVKLTQGLGKYIKQYGENTRFQRYLEVGTWNGRGSTMCFAAGFENRKDSPVLKSLETNEIMFLEASNVWKPYPNIHILHSRILSNIPAVNTIHTSINEEWHSGDITAFNTASYFDVQAFLPEVVCLDGGEYITYFEYLEVKDICKVFLLDDTAVAKCKRIVEELRKDPSWKCVAGNDQERNGWAVFERLEPIDVLSCKDKMP